MARDSGIGHRRWDNLHCLWWRASGANTGFHPDCRTHGNANAGTDADPRANSFAHPDCRAYTNCDAGADRCAYTNCQARANLYADTGADCHT